MSNEYVELMGRWRLMPVRADGVEAVVVELGGVRLEGGGEDVVVEAAFERTAGGSQPCGSCWVAGRR